MEMRQRIIDAINHKDSGYVPWNIELTSHFAKKMQTETGCSDCDQALGNHMLRLKYKKNSVSADGLETDLFGVRWTRADDGGDVGVVAHYPIQEQGFAAYRFPSVDATFALSVCARLARETERFRMFSITMGFFERAWSLMGMEDVLAGMALHEPEVEAIFAAIQEHHLALLDLVLPHEFEALYFGDDWGQQRGLIMGPDHWRTYIKPGVAALFAKARAAGKLIVLHSCGDLREIMPDLIEIGVDVYNTVQPKIYDLKTLKREYGKDLTFYGGISTQQFLPTASRQETIAMTKRVLGLMGQGGGYILSPTHSVTPDIPVDVILAMVETVKKYNR